MSLDISLPAIVCKGLIGLGHAVNVFLLLYGCAATISGVQQLIAQLVDHALFAASAGVGNQPADGQGSTPVGIHFHRHLIIRATHAASLHFEQWLGVLDCFFEELQSFVSALL